MNSNQGNLRQLRTEVAHGDLQRPYPVPGDRSLFSLIARAARLEEHAKKAKNLLRINI